MMSSSTTHERPSPFPDPATARGQIQVIFGPMFSGKSTELLRRMRRYKLANYKCLVIKYAKDTRYDLNGVATHDKQTLDAVPATDLLSLTSLAVNSDVVGIDEGQFFPDVVEFCDRMAELGKIVIVAALDGTFQKVGFGKILELVPLAESVVKLTAVCMRCYQDASFTKRIGQETQVEVIGGADKYLAVCRNCFLSPKKTTKENPPNFTNLNKNTSSMRKIFDSKTSDDKENTPILSDFSVDTKFSRKLFSTPNRLNLPS